MANIGWHSRCFICGMTYKQSIATHKSWAHTGSFSFSPAGIIAKLKNAIKSSAPVGYQDETGFHYGVKPVDQEVKWPSAV
jgi:hypothetical protein